VTPHVADKEWYCGQLIQDLHAQLWRRRPDPDQVVAQTPGRVEAVPLEHYARACGARWHPLHDHDNFNGTVADVPEKAAQMSVLCTTLHRVRHDLRDPMPTYTKRGALRILRGNAFPGMNPCRPSISTRSRRCYRCASSPSRVDNFRHDSDPPISKDTELIHRESSTVFRAVQLCGNLIEVASYGFEHERLPQLS